MNSSVMKVTVFNPTKETITATVTHQDGKTYTLPVPPGSTLQTQMAVEVTGPLVAKAE